MKNLLAGALTLALTAPSFADTSHGAYVGVGAGAVIAHHTNNRLAFNGIGPFAAVSQDSNANLNRYAAAFSLLAGYAWKIQSWHLGAEIDYLFGNINTKFNQTGLQQLPLPNSTFVSVKSFGAWGGGIKVGYYWDRILGFVRLGLEGRRFKINGILTPVAAPDMIDRNTISTRVNRTAFAPGIGVQMSINKNISATLEYRIALYRRINKEISTTEGTTSVKIDPRVSTLLASFRYHF
ncbi:MAG: outer membrane protein [Candidatus Paracaedibacter sp.]